MSQPVWKLIAQLGDENPIDYGGYFIYRDETGVYPEEAEVLELVDGYGKEPDKWMVYRFALEQCTYIEGVLSDNKFHPWKDAWFASDIEAIASSAGNDPEELRRLFCSEDPLERAEAYRCLTSYHSIHNLDQYPLEFTDRAEVEARYED